MTYEVNDAEFKSVSELLSEARYHYFVEKVADWEELWSLGNADGWAVAADDSGNELIPVWPAKAFAHACCAGTWENYEPRTISLALWLEKWTPGLIADHRAVVVFPLINDKGILVSPERLRVDLAKSIEQYE